MVDDTFDSPYSVALEGIFHTKNHEPEEKRSLGSWKCSGQNKTGIIIDTAIFSGTLSASNTEDLCFTILHF